MDPLEFNQIWDVIESLFPHIRSSKDYENINYTNPRYIHKIKDHCKKIHGFRPLFNEIKIVFKEKIDVGKKPSKPMSIKLDYIFNNDETKNDSTLEIKKILKQRNYTIFETSSNDFILAKNEQYGKNILIYVSNQKFKKQLEIPFHDLHDILNHFEWFWRNYYGQEILEKSLTRYGWESSLSPEFRQTALKRKMIVESNLSRIIKSLKLCKINQNIDPSIIERDILWVITHENRFFELKILLIHNAREILLKAGLIPRYSDRDSTINLVFVINISKN